MNGDTVTFRKHIWIFVNGIMTFPGDADNWNARAVAHCLSKGILADRMEYFVGPISRAFGQKARVKKLVGAIRWFRRSGFDISLCGHSNGCDVILRAAHTVSDRIQFQRIVLISAATPADCTTNHMNSLAAASAVKQFQVFCGGEDIPLKLVSLSHLAKLVGYGALGLHGPRNTTPTTEAITVVRKMPEYGHSDWFKVAGGNFDDLMGKVLKPLE